MVKWAIIIGALAIFNILGLFLDFPAEYLYIVPALSLLAVVAMLYRVYNKTKQGGREKLERELSELRSKIEGDMS
jgi:hypothetical protein